MCKSIAFDIISALPQCMAAQGVHDTATAPLTDTPTTTTTALSTAKTPATTATTPSTVIQDTTSTASSTALHRGNAPLTGFSEPANGEVESEGNKPQGEIWISSGEDQVAGSGQVQEDTAFDSTTSACFGQPIMCRYEGCKKEFTDGFGLCSPGRWLPGARNYLAKGAATKHAEQVVEILHDFLVKEIGDLRREAFRLALGHYQQSPFSPEQLQTLRRKIATLLRPGDEDALLVQPPRQPFFLYLLAESLRELDDPDWEILVQGEECFAKGVPLGVENSAGV